MEWRTLSRGSRNQILTRLLFAEWKERYPRTIKRTTILDAPPNWLREIPICRGVSLLLYLAKVGMEYEENCFRFMDCFYLLVYC